MVSTTHYRILLIALFYYYFNFPWSTSISFAIYWQIAILSLGTTCLDDSPAAADPLRIMHQRLPTCHNQGEWDHDSAQQLVGYGIVLERVSDGIIVAEETPFKGVMLRGEDEEGKSNC